MGAFRRHDFHGILAKRAGQIVLLSQDGETLPLHAAPGLERFVGEHVHITGVLGEGTVINAFEVEKD